MLTLIAGLLTANLLSRNEATQSLPEVDSKTTKFASWPGNASHQFVVVPVNPDGSINVRVKEAALTEVSIRDISTSDELQVKIKDEVKVHVAGSEWHALKNAGPIEVGKE